MQNTFPRFFFFLSLHRPAKIYVKSNLRKSSYVSQVVNVLILQSMGHAVVRFVEALRFTRKVEDSIRDGVIGIFHWRNPSGRTMALGSTQPLTEMGTRNISWGLKAAGA